MSFDPSAASEMILRGRKASLRLSVVRYQFPQISSGDYDANWLLIEGHVSLDDRSWTFRDPALTTLEVLALADWLEGLERGAPVENGCSFIEPTLQFDRVSDTMIRVAFVYGGAPPWADVDDDWSAHGFDVLIDRHLKIAAESLREQLKAFPPRGEWATRSPDGPSSQSR